MGYADRPAILVCRSFCYFPMVKIEIEYTGGLHSEAVHTQSGTRLQTDAPLDNGGKGESFSPTDLVATALGTCMTTTMDLYAKRNGFNIDGTKAIVVKHMMSQPVRRIGKLEVVVTSLFRQIIRNAQLSKRSL